MSNYLFTVGRTVNVQQADNKSTRMLIIGTCVRDEKGVLHDYAGVIYPEGYIDKIACFEHREILRGDD